MKNEQSYGVEAYADLRERLLGKSIEVSEPINERRRGELEKEIGGVAKIFNGFGRPWFMAGGTALDLAEGKLTRDHQDNDIAIFYDDVGAFFGYTTKLGYEFFDVKGKKIETAEELLSQRENGFVTKSDESMRTCGFEIVFLRRDAQGDVYFGHNNQLTFPKELYENAQKYNATNNETVPITPKDIQLLYKIFEGRQCDYLDIKKFLPTLTKAEQQRLSAYLESLSATFAVDNQETKNLDELLQLIESRTATFKQDLNKTFDKIISEDYESFNENIVKIYRVAKRIGSQNNFLSELVKEFGERAATAWSTGELDSIAQFLFKNPMPTLEEFGQAFNPEPRIEQRFKNEIRNMPRWEMKTGDKQ